MKFPEIARLFPRHSYVRAIICTLSLSILIMGMGFSARTAPINSERLPWETKRILSGIVSDFVCGQGHGIKGHGDRECTRICVKLGANYALVDNKDLFILKGHESELDQYAGEKVIVAGAVMGNVVRVESVAPLDLVHGQ